MKRFYEINFNGEPYDAVAKRKGQDLFYILGGDKVAKPAAGTVPKIASKSFVPKTTTTTTQPKSSISSGMSQNKPSVGGGGTASKKSTGASGASGLSDEHTK